MGNLIKINMYADKKKSNDRNINISILEENFATYEKWLEKNNKKDGVENYKKFLMIG